MIKVVIVGAGQAGALCALNLRRQGFEGEIVLIGDEKHCPYERPPLSKAALLGTGVRPTFVGSKMKFESLTVQLRLKLRALRVSRAAKTIELSDGSQEHYDYLILATGSRPRPFSIPGSELPGIHTLRTLDDAKELKKSLESGGRVLIVGGGWIGLEVAASARSKGLEVTVVEAGSKLCSRVLPSELSDYLRAIHQSKGVEIELDTTVSLVDGEDRVEVAALSSGRRIPVSTVVVGIGAIPNAEIALQSGLIVENGIIVDEFCRTSDESIFAVGDVACQYNEFARRLLRLESWENAQLQAMKVAKTIVGAAQTAASIPWFWSDQYDLRIQMLGLPGEFDSTVMRGSIQASEFSQIYLKDGKIIYACSVNHPKELATMKKLMMKGITIELDKLASVENLSELVA